MPRSPEARLTVPAPRSLASGVHSRSAGETQARSARAIVRFRCVVALWETPTDTHLGSSRPFFREAIRLRQELAEGAWLCSALRGGPSLFPVTTLHEQTTVATIATSVSSSRVLVGR